MVQIHVERTIAAAPERVFDWLTDPANLTSAPLLVKATWMKDSPGPRLGALREVTGIGVWLREQITAYEPPHSYSYLVVRSLPASNHEGGTVTVTPSGAGAHVDWKTAFTIPVSGGGKVTEAVTSPLFRWTFRAILAGCARALES